ncbi:MAG: response regulator transcription factor [Rubrivivax sp.]|nr:response regulator transcription factor [Rubrivivax sp.]MCL4697342.1 response regulator transcription factor [Burkholderiaceae bacterium]
MKVALVEDSAHVRNVLARLLSAIEGVELAGEAEDVAGAIALVERTAPDLVVLDVELRDHGRGIDVLRQLQREHPGVEVIVLSNYGWSAMRDAFLAGGARAYFDKAFEFGQALQWIRERQAAAMATTPAVAAAQAPA